MGVAERRYKIARGGSGGIQHMMPLNIRSFKKGTPERENRTVLESS